MFNCNHKYLDFQHLIASVFKITYFIMIIIFIVVVVVVFAVVAP